MRLPRWPAIVKYGRGKEDVAMHYSEIITQDRIMGHYCDLIIVVMPAKNTDIYSEFYDMNL